MTVHDGVRYDLDVDSGVLDVAHSVELIADTLRRRWGVQSGAASNEPPTYPIASPWASELAPWES